MENFYEKLYYLQEISAEINKFDWDLESIKEELQEVYEDLYKQHDEASAGMELELNNYDDDAYDKYSDREHSLSKRLNVCEDLISSIDEIHKSFIYGPVSALDYYAEELADLSRQAEVEEGDI